MREDVVFPTPARFDSQSCRSCSPLFLLPKASRFPHERYRNGTLTFVIFEEELFGITCHHVIKAARATKSTIATVRRIVFPFRAESFCQPPADFTGQRPDVAITRLGETFLKRIAKRAIRLADSPIDLSEVEHGIAVGYPESYKLRHTDQHGERIGSPCVHLVAAKESEPEAPRFTLFSELEETPQITNFSGMSGGPLFYTSAHHYELLGITLRALPSVAVETPRENEVPFGGAPRLVITAERVTYARFAEWLDDMPAA